MNDTCGGLLFTVAEVDYWWCALDGTVIPHMQATHPSCYHCHRQRDGRMVKVLRRRTIEQVELEGLSPPWITIKDFGGSVSHEAETGSNNELANKVEFLAKVVEKRLTDLQRSPDIYPTHTFNWAYQHLMEASMWLRRFDFE